MGSYHREFIFNDVLRTKTFNCLGDGSGRYHMNLEIFHKNGFTPKYGDHIKYSQTFGGEFYNIYLNNVKVI